MALQIVTRNGGLFPSFRFPTLLDMGEEEFFTTPLSETGLSISEDDKHVYVEAQVPGVDPKDVEVMFEKGTLTIRAEAKEEEKKEEKKRKFYRRAQRSFLYRAAVPVDIDTTVEPGASYKNGVVTVTLVKAAKLAPKKILVKAD